MGIDDLFKGNIVTALAIGVGGVIFVPIIARVAKPVAKMAIKGGLVAYNKGREAVHEAGEVVGDLVAEIKSERHAAADEPLLAAAGAAGATGTVARHVSSAKAAIKKAPTAKASRPKPAKKVAAKAHKAKS